MTGGHIRRGIVNMPIMTRDGEIRRLQARRRRLNEQYCSAVNDDKPYRHILDEIGLLDRQIERYKMGAPVPRYKVGSEVKFMVGLAKRPRYITGVIIGWYSNSADAIIYQINKNGRAYKLVYQDDVRELIK